LLDAHRPLLESAGMLDSACFYSPNPGGCPSCQRRGYSGRLAIIEVYPLEGMERAIAERRPESEIRAAMKERGFRDLREDGILKASQGLTTVEEVLNVV